MCTYFVLLGVLHEVNAEVRLVVAGKMKKRSFLASFTTNTSLNYFKKMSDVTWSSKVAVY